MSSMHPEWYHNLKLSQHTALWWSQVTGNSQQPQGYIDVGPGFAWISPDKIIMRSVRVFDGLDPIKVLISVRCKKFTWLRQWLQATAAEKGQPNLAKRKWWKLVNGSTCNLVFKDTAKRMNARKWMLNVMLAWKNKKTKQK